MGWNSLCLEWGMVGGHFQVYPKDMSTVRTIHMSYEKVK